MGKITDLLKPEGEKRIFAMRQPGIEPGSTAWKAAMLTTIPPTLVKLKQRVKSIYIKKMRIASIKIC